MLLQRATRLASAPSPVLGLLQGTLGHRRDNLKLADRRGLGDRFRSGLAAARSLVSWGWLRTRHAEFHRRSRPHASSLAATFCGQRRGRRVAKPRMFIASSVEHLDLAYAVQEGLEHDVEATVWSQGVFQLSRTAMASLIDQLDESDFGLFVLAPDDVTAIRDAKKNTVRDNVVFELGLFIGRLGTDRCFLIVPRGVEDLHLPTDLTGITPATFDPDRQDGNVVAALGPACNRIRKSIAKYGPIKSAVEIVSAKAEESVHTEKLTSDPNDCISLIESWMGERPSTDNTRAIRYSDVDRELKLAPGSALKYLEQAASRWGYSAARKGEATILFRSTRGY